MASTFTVKICGLSDAATLDVALDAGADMVGFVFFEPSPRHVSLATAAALGARVEGRARKVALTVDADDGMLDAIVAALKPDLLQLHGHETPERVATLRARFGLPLIRALSVADRRDLAQVAAFETVADHLLLDARAPSGASRPGGNGSAFDWTLLQGFAAARPWLLAGGLDAANVAEAVTTTIAPGLDISSGVETAPGRKDPRLIVDFIGRAREAALARHRRRCA